MPQPVRPDAPPSRPHMPPRGSLIPRARNRRRQSTGVPPCRAMAAIETRCDRRRPAKRPRRMGLCSEVADGGKIWRTTPPSRPDTFAARPRFSRQIARQVGSGGVEPFSFGPDKILPGTLHHSGNRPAPPSDHTPLARRSAFQQGRKRGRRGNSDAPAGLKHLLREDFCRPLRGKGVCQHGTMKLCGSTPVIARGVRQGTACPVSHAPHRVENRSRVEARSAPTGVLIGVRPIGGRAGTPALFAPAQVNRR